MNKTIISMLMLFSFNSFANVGGSDLQNFNPTTNGKGFVTVHPSATLSQGEFNLGSFLTFTTNSLPYSTISSAPNNQTFTEPNDTLLYSNLHFGVGILQGWDIGVSGGFINSQNIQESNFLFAYGDTGINEFRLNSKVRLYNDNNVGFAVIVGADFDQIKNNPFTGDNAGPSYNFEGAVDMLIMPGLLWAVNGGYRLRLEGTTIPNTGVTPISDQFIYSTAVSYQTDDHGSALIGEIYGSLPFEENTTPTDRLLSNLELLLGYRWRGLEYLDVHGGVGTEVYHGLGSPDIRVYLGLNWRMDFFGSDTPSSYQQTSPVEREQPEPLSAPETNLQNTDSSAGDSDGDGVADPIDECPNTWGQNYVDARGCTKTESPEAEQMSDEPDSDADGIVDSLDRCQGTTQGASVNAYGCEVSEYEN